MSENSKPGPYVYQPHPVTRPDGRLWHVGGWPDGMSRAEADAVVAAFWRVHGPSSDAAQDQPQNQPRGGPGPRMPERMGGDDGPVDLDALAADVKKLTVANKLRFAGAMLERGQLAAAKLVGTRALFEMEVVERFGGKPTR